MHAHLGKSCQHRAVWVSAPPDELREPKGVTDKRQAGKEPSCKPRPPGHTRCLAGIQVHAAQSPDVDPVARNRRTRNGVGASRTDLN